MKEAKIPLIYSRILISQVGRQLGRQRLHAPGFVQGDTNGFISNGQYVALLRLIRKISNDPLITLRAGANVPFSVHGPLGIAAMSSNTLGEALQTLSRYAELRSPFCRIELQHEGEQAVLSLLMEPVLQEQEEPALDFIVATLARSILSLIAEPLATFHVELKRKPPPQVPEYAATIGCPVHFNRSRNALVLKASDLLIPSAGANQEEYQRAMERIRSLTLEDSRQLPVKDQVLCTFSSRTGHLCSLEESAQVLDTSPRTLQRWLRAEGTSFYELRDQWLAEQSLRLIRKDGLSVEVTATLLGYSDTSNFRRSFKRWFNKPPSKHRDEPNEALRNPE